MPRERMSSEMCYMADISQGLNIFYNFPQKRCADWRRQQPLTAMLNCFITEHIEFILAFMLNLTTNFAQNSKNIRTNKLSVNKKYVFEFTTPTM